MFVSHRSYEFAVPTSLASPGVQHWRVVELMHHTPWFLLTADETDEMSGINRAHTWCIAWELDLVQALGELAADKIQSLVYMVPGWVTNSGHWMACAVGQVWLNRTADAAEFVSLFDADGCEVTGGTGIGRTAEVTERQLLLHLPSTIR